MDSTDRRTRIRVKNFKGLKDTTIDLENFNVLIGSNGSGKTSILELFKLMNMCTSPDSTPMDPFADWWGFGNAVWSGNERLVISMHMQYTAAGRDVEYRSAVSGADGAIMFKEESLSIDGYLNVRRRGGRVEYALDEGFVEKHQTVIDDGKRDYESNMGTFLAGHEVMKLSRSKSILDILLGVVDFLDGMAVVNLHFPDAGRRRDLYIPSPASDGNRETTVLYEEATTLFEGKRRDEPNQGIILMRNLNYDALRNPAQTNNPALLREDGNGMINILFGWHMNGGMPFRIQSALEELFPGWSLGFELTPDGRILMRVTDGDMRLNPPSIPDGFYRLLAILVAVEMEPRFLLIDELETSMHGRMIEHVLGDLQTCNATVAVTTHSPAVIDLVELENLILLERSGDGTACRRIENPSKMRHALRDEGLTASERWLYGKI